MIRLQQAVVCEGKYDKIKLSSVIDGIIIPTDGFGIFRNKEKLGLLRRLARTRGIVIFTDSDAAGFKIRSYLGGSIPEGKIYHAYIPDILGKEKRKEKPSSEGKLGVEGVPMEVITSALERAGVTGLDTLLDHREKITKLDLYNDGISGGAESKTLRLALLKQLDLPERLSVNAMLEVMNAFITKEEYQEIVREVKKHADTD